MKRQKIILIFHGGNGIVFELKHEPTQLRSSNILLHPIFYCNIAKCVLQHHI